MKPLILYVDKNGFNDGSDTSLVAKLPYQFKGEDIPVIEKSAYTSAIETLELLVNAMAADGLLKTPVDKIPHTAHALQFAQMELERAKGGT